MMVGLPGFFIQKTLFAQFFKSRREKKRRIDACLKTLEGWSIEDLEDPNQRIRMLTLIAPDNVEIINLTWKALPVGEPVDLDKVFTAQVG